MKSEDHESHLDSIDLIIAMHSQAISMAIKTDLDKEELFVFVFLQCINSSPIGC